MEWLVQGSLPFPWLLDHTHMPCPVMPCHVLSHTPFITGSHLPTVVVMARWDNPH